MDRDEASTTADQVLADSHLQGVRILVTGASGGLGKETARALVARGAEVILAARSAQKLAAARKEIERDTGKSGVETLLLDLASLDAVATAAEDFLRRYGVLDVLINNAGVMACPLMRTADGFEMQFGVCHLGHFVFTGLMLPALLAAGSARVVNLSSAGHRLADIDFDDPNYEHRRYDKWQAYGQAKSANCLFSLGLTRRFASRGITSNAVHPGAIAETGLGRHMRREDYEALMAMQPAGSELHFISLQAGAATSVWAATASELQDRGGLYLEDCRIAAVNDQPDSQGGYCSRVLDPVRADRLWQLSEALTGRPFGA